MKIKSSSEAQLALIPQVLDEWLKIGWDTKLVDPEKVLEILGRLYAVAHKPAPKQVVFLDSPQQIALAIGELRIAGEPIRLQVSDLVSGQVNGEVQQKPRDQINEQVGRLVTGQAVDKFFAAEHDPNLLVVEHIQAQVGEPSRDRFRGLRASPLRRDFGQFDISLAWFDFVGRLGFDVSKLTPTFDLAKACGWAVLFWDWAYISAKPEYIRRDEQHRLHCENGPALRYPDGFSVYAIHGVRVPKKLVMSVEPLAVQEIETEFNVEVRRLMIARYGQERFLMDSGAAEVHRDDFGILYRKEIPGDEPLVMVKVVNSTPEPGGSFKDYFLRVPPEMKRAKQAVAWTFGKEENDYAPEWQT